MTEPSLYLGCDCGGEHRTVGPHRAWCHGCHEWCYPDNICEVQALRDQKPPQELFDGFRRMIQEQADQVLEIVADNLERMGRRNNEEHLVARADQMRGWARTIGEFRKWILGDE